MRRLATAITVLVIVIPLQGAIAGSGSTSGTEIAFYNPGSSSWQVPGRTPFFYGAPGDTPLLCDWDGDGVATVGVYRESTGYLLLQDENSTGAADYSFYYGIPGDRPLCGDWDGDGVDTIGVFRPSNRMFYLRNHNSQGFGDWSFEFGFASGIPFAGDFNGDSKDTIGLRDPKNGFVSLARSLFTDQAVMEAYFGSAADTLVVGDWDGDGTDRLAVYQPATNTLAVTNLFGSTKVAHVYDLGKVDGIPLAAEFDPAGGVATSTPEWKGIPANVVTSKPAPAVKAPAAATPAAPILEAPAQLPPTPAPPAEPAPAEQPPVEAFAGPPPAPAGGRYLGPGFAGLGLQDLDSGGGFGRQYGTAQSFTASKTGSITAVRLYLTWESGGYGAGTGGTMRVSIRNQDASVPIDNFLTPATTVDRSGPHASTMLGSVTHRDPLVGSAPNWNTEYGGSTNAGVLFTFESPVAVTAGTTYWIVIENLDGSPAANFVSIESIRHASGPAADDWVIAYSGLGGRGDGWYIRNSSNVPGSIRDIPLHEIVYADGTRLGNGYMHGFPYLWSARDIGGGNRVRMHHPTNYNGTVQTVFLFVGKKSSTPSPLQLSVDGGPLVNGVEIAPGAYPSSGSGTFSPGDEVGRTWVQFTLPSPVVDPTDFVWSSQSDDWRAYPLKGGSGLGFDAAVMDPGVAQYSTGGSWHGFNDWGPSESSVFDLMWYAPLQ